MSLYNAVFGFNPACVLLLPLIGKRREDFPRFRDCFAENIEARTICILTRTGGGYRDGYEEENDAITKFEGYVKDWDDGFDSTFAYWEIAVPEKWHADYDSVVKGGMANVSKGYVDLVKGVYPELADQIEKIVANARGGSNE